MKNYFELYSDLFYIFIAKLMKDLLNELYCKIILFKI